MRRLNPGHFFVGATWGIGTCLAACLAWQTAIAQDPMPNGNPGLPTSCAAAAPVHLLKVFSDDEKSAYLGCWNCDPDALDSVKNAKHRFGDARYPNSLRNRMGLYGSWHAEIITSACNRSATKPPLLKGSSGELVGKLSINWSLKGSLCNPNDLEFFHHELCKQLTEFCRT